MKYELGFATTAGRRGGENEDFAVQYIPSDAATLARKGALFAIADGMGGHKAGHVASRLALQALASAYYRDSYDNIPWSLEQAVQVANQTVLSQAARVPQYSGMGTTLVAAIVRGKQAFIASVGDSRAYFLRGTCLWKITRDHSYAADLVAMGSLSPKQALRHPLRNRLTRAIGRRASVSVDLFQGVVAENDTLFLCTDGLSDWIAEGELSKAIAHQQNPTRAAQELVMLSYRRGSEDNITSYIVRLIPVPLPARPAERAQASVPPTRLGARVYGGAVAAQSQSDFVYLLFILLGSWLVIWATFFAVLIMSRLHH